MFHIPITGLCTRSALFYLNPAATAVGLPLPHGLNGENMKEQFPSTQSGGFPPIPDLPLQLPGSCHSGRSQPDQIVAGEGAPLTAIRRLLSKWELCRLCWAYSEPLSLPFCSADALGSPEDHPEAHR